MAGGGGVFRGWRGEWLEGFAERMGVCSFVRAELRAMLRGLLLVKERRFTKLVVKVDSMLVVGMLKGSLCCNTRHYAIVQRRKGLLESPNCEVLVSHCYQETNQVADTLMNLGINLDCDLVLFTEPPKEAFTSLYAD